MRKARAAARVAATDRSAPCSIAGCCLPRAWPSLYCADHAAGVGKGRPAAVPPPASRSDQPEADQAEDHPPPVRQRPRPRPGDGQSRAIPFRKGDWTCHSCGYHNFSLRNRCFQCNASVATGQDYGRSMGADYIPQDPATIMGYKSTASQRPFRREDDAPSPSWGDEEAARWLALKFRGLKDLLRQEGYHVARKSAAQLMNAWESLLSAGVSVGNDCAKIVVSLLGWTRNHQLGQEVYDAAVLRGVEPDLHLMLALAHAYSRAGDVKAVRKLLQEAQDKGLIGSTTPVTADGTPVLLKALQERRKQMAGATPQELAAVDSELHEVIHDVRRRGGQLPLQLYRIAISRARSSAEATALLDSLRTHHLGSVRSLRILNPVLCACAAAGDPETAERHFKVLAEQGAIVDADTHGNLVLAHAKAGRLVGAARALQRMTDSGFEVAELAVSAFILACAAKPQHPEAVQLAEALFTDARIRGTVTRVATWRSLLRVYAAAGLPDRAESLRAVMRQESIRDQVGTIKLVAEAHEAAGDRQTAAEYAEWIERRRAGLTAEPAPSAPVSISTSDLSPPSEGFASLLSSVLRTAMADGSGGSAPAAGSGRAPEAGL
eukprot:TRINITY_DN41685_c0_g1_i1.p1 TRINITY_DN41685_c0_g1~~TRINITY_DN41685_c0_g1_i1.p1  ORF type:complete len:606 (+),score=68.70 TRINITY_DN41685_c0_g1_i1:437-2254(+)